MALASGTRLGPYEVTAQIGAGGMGEVYREERTSRMELPRKHDKWLKHTQSTLDYVDATLRNRRTAVDAGAAEGLITKWLADRFDLVHAFEPVPENFALSRAEATSRVRRSCAADLITRHSCLVDRHQPLQLFVPVLDDDDATHRPNQVALGA